MGPKLLWPKMVWAKMIMGRNDKRPFDLVLVLTEIGRSSKAYTELCGRTEVMVTDVLMALVDQGKWLQMF